MSKILEEYGIEEDSRYKQCFKEAMACIYVYAIHMLFVFACVYFLKDQPGDIFGLPLYLFWGVFMGSIGLVVAVWALTKFYFQNISLEVVETSKNDEALKSSKDR